MSRRVASILFLGSLAWTAIHHRRVTLQQQLPQAFKILTKRGITYGFYTRKLNRPIQTTPIDANDENVSAALLTFTRAFLACKLYKLEILMSGATEDPLTFSIVQGERFGNLVVDQIVNPNEVVLNYVYPGFDFKLYLKVDERKSEVSVGFVEYTGQIDASLGQKVYSGMLVESAARLLEECYVS